MLVRFSLANGGDFAVTPSNVVAVYWGKKENSVDCIPTTIVLGTGEEFNTEESFDEVLEKLGSI